MRKRERENPCHVCGHYHKYEEGEVCGICGHWKLSQEEGASASTGVEGHSAFPAEILPQFLFLGTYDHASRSELLRAQGISHVLNAVPTCPNLYRNTFSYFSIPDAHRLPFDDCFQFIEQARNSDGQVLVHCMSGQSRSPAIVVGYLMRRNGWRVEEAESWVRQRKPSIKIAQELREQLRAYEDHLFSSQALGTAVAPPTTEAAAGPQGSAYPAGSAAGHTMLSLAQLQQPQPNQMSSSGSSSVTALTPAGLGGPPESLQPSTAPPMLFPFEPTPTPNLTPATGFVFGSHQAESR